MTPEDSLGEIDHFSFYFKPNDETKHIYVYLFVIRDSQRVEINKEEGKWYPINDALTLLKHEDAKNALQKGNKLLS